MKATETSVSGSDATLLDRPSQAVPSADQPWDDPMDRLHRAAARRGDLSTHRAYHSVFEDMLN